MFMGLRSWHNKRSINVHKKRIWLCNNNNNNDTNKKHTYTLHENIERTNWICISFQFNLYLWQTLITCVQPKFGEKKQEKSTFSSKSNNIIHKITFDYLNEHTEKRTKAMLFHPFNTINKMKSNKILTGY